MRRGASVFGLAIRLCTAGTSANVIYGLSSPGADGRNCNKTVLRPVTTTTVRTEMAVQQYKTIYRITGPEGLSMNNII